MGIFDDLRLKYKTGQLTVKFIFINVALFLVERLTDVFCTLLGVPYSKTPYRSSARRMSRSSPSTLISWPPNLP